MPHFCCVGECTNNSEKRKDLSFHSLPIENKQLLNVWINKIRRDPRYFQVNKHTKICSAHFSNEDFIEPEATKKRLKKGVVPHLFEWTDRERVPRKNRTSDAIQKLTRFRKEDDASEGEGDENEQLGLVSRKTQVSEDQFCVERHAVFSCYHRFSIPHLLSRCNTEAKEKKLFSHFTGFSSYEVFKQTLLFLVPEMDRKCIIYWQSESAKSNRIDLEQPLHLPAGQPTPQKAEYSQSKTREHGHKLSVEDEFLLLLMKLRMGLSHLDLSERFCISEGAVNNILISWCNFIYLVLGSMKIWPDRRIILENAPHEFIEKYPNNVIIIDATEIKIQVPSALQKHSESFSSYKSHTTLKGLIGVDPNGGVMFVSQLYEGSISDQQIVKIRFFRNIKTKASSRGNIYW